MPGPRPLIQAVLPAFALAALCLTQANAAPPKARPASAARDVQEANGLYDFGYSYPAAAGSIPALRALLDADLAKQKADLIAEARSSRAEARKEGFPFRAHAIGIGWQVVTDLPDWLSLSASIGSDQGGAHPNHNFDALLWDKRANVRRKVEDLFTSKQALRQAIQPEFCRQLNLQRQARRGEPVPANSDDEFDKCIDPLESSVILGSSNRRTFDRIGVLVAPYAAGPYAEGEYEVTLPVTDATLAAVKPQYRASFSVKR